MEGSSSMVVNEENDVMDLPPGFRFHPTDEEIITHYLTKKVLDERLTTIAIGEVDMNKCEPWDLPKKAKMWGKEWFFFCQKDRKYPTGMRTNRATNTGYWKATGKDREIHKGKGCLIGMKKTLVFYKGRAPKGDKSNWVMHEYRLEGKLSYSNFPRGAKDEWVVSKIFHKNSTAIKSNQYADHLARNDSINVQILETPTLPPLVEAIPNSHMPSSSFTHDEEEEFKGKTSSSSAKPTQAFFSSYFTNNNSDLQFQEHQRNDIFLPNYYTNAFNASYQSSNNRIQENPVFLDYQPTECVNPSVSAANIQHCKMEQFSSNNSRVSQSQDTDISSGLSNRACEFEDLEGISVRHDMQYLDNLWDY